MGEEVSWMSVGERTGEGELKKNAGWCPRPLKNYREVAGIVALLHAPCALSGRFQYLLIWLQTNTQLLDYVTLTVLIQSFAIYSCQWQSTWSLRC